MKNLLLLFFITAQQVKSTDKLNEIIFYSVVHFCCTGSGKTYTMFGTTNDGVINRCVDMIFKTKPSVKLNVSVIEMINSDLFDLLNESRNVIRSNELAGKTALESSTQFNNLVSKVLKIRKHAPTDQNITSSRSHLMFEMSLQSSLIKLAFVDLAGWECPNNKLMAETQFINASLSSLNNALTCISKKKRKTFDSPITKWLKPYLEDARCIMMYHVQKLALKKGLENIKGVVPTSETSKRKAVFDDITNKRSCFP